MEKLYLKRDFLNYSIIIRVLINFINQLLNNDLEQYKIFNTKKN